MKPTLTFIGAGHMAGSLIAGLIADGYDPSLIWATAPSTENLKKLSQEFSIRTTTDNYIGVEKADVLILAVKPQIMQQVLEPLHDIIQQKRPLIISIASRITVHDLEQWTAPEMAIIRCMPNMPALIQAGATALFANQKVSSDQKDIAESIMRAVGVTLWLEREADINIVTVISGCGPAYFFLLMEMMQEIAIDMGLPAKTAQLLCMQTAIGAARLALESSHDPATLRRQVTSPGGTTERIMEVLEDGKIRDLFLKALSAGKERTEALGKKV